MRPPRRDEVVPIGNRGRNALRGNVAGAHHGQEDEQLDVTAPCEHVQAIHPTWPRLGWSPKVTSPTSCAALTRRVCWGWGPLRLLRLRLNGENQLLGKGDDDVLPDGEVFEHRGILDVHGHGVSLG